MVNVAQVSDEAPLLLCSSAPLLCREFRLNERDIRLRGIEPSPGTFIAFPFGKEPSSHNSLFEAELISSSSPISSLKESSPPSSEEISSPKESSPAPSAEEISSPKESSPAPSAEEISSSKESSPVPSAEEISSPKESSPPSSAEEISSSKESSPVPSAEEISSSKESSPAPSAEEISSSKESSPVPSTEEISSSSQTSFRFDTFVVSSSGELEPFDNSVLLELEGIGTANNKLCNAAEANSIDGESCRIGTSKLFRRNDLIMYLALGIWIAQRQEKTQEKTDAQSETREL